MKRCFIITKKAILITTAIILSAIFAFLIFSSKNIFVPTSASERLLPIYSTQQNEKKIAFSFDAAWGAEDTETLIDIFNKYNIKVTFFVVGDWVDRFPDKVKLLHEAGHEIQNHSDSHPHLTNLSTQDIVKELENCNKKIQDITGICPTLMRPPYGDYDNKVIEATDSLGMHTIQWSVDSLDWKDLSAEEIKTRVLSAIEPGSIVLFHNAAKHTPEALPSLIEALQKDGYQFVPISQLIYTENYTIDHTGKQIPNVS
jgi:polysaccharide deacetylase family sporulation protein PdaB